ncbi:2,3-bisphosphoglycerate-dependent phosphoglycerate mutase [Paraburkholderia caballeronis]|uniref:2,3-bisphosphoglycerate-dependent phosphoglycerate mutase n=1 Tax=Paraburkholderia caballeronis TaxID=416943 RepID=A0A1H7F7G8_9BURK|nr:2,3-bisphosphoglycerate-dependent phosphoglycerate mutase [Paraburkholderia caballeronis]PXW23921.1 2,3-bisphosphoglycerate-dependent phosphoglycerate mutase [Paraburkholderia caballeronis]PXW99685.1 2,3-bisphosphoglycerate-dependent phosphoglycerate mutase [Paraburkholderia caballeronis]RAJ96639.1 2,3-bisphosphoglycerate-dependent phosphoglycerate mutase [Paraburkholderia caballeronis]SEE78435.1 2,3-bisphosphoglycerate-dependent phosphoglycerate mutase [Paraburkholderia caballeronis]SEK199
MDDRATLVVLRHGQSEWNRANRFTGWVDVPLSAHGVEQAQHIGEQLDALSFRFDLAVTSALQRATRTLDLIVARCGVPQRPVVRSWRLNDRHYGVLTGMDKDEAAASYGVEQVRVWRRGFAEAPPPLDDARQREIVARFAARFADASLPDPDALPRTESLRDTLARVLPLWDGTVAPALRGGGSVLMVAHGNALRALFKHLDGIDDARIASLEVAHAEPLVLRFDDSLRIVSRAGLGAFAQTQRIPLHRATEAGSSEVS